MNYTEKYHLPQWKKEDRIMMEDFNQMCQDMEAGLKSNAQAAEKAAELPYVVGTYPGGVSRTIEVGFQPSAVLIGPDYEASSSNAIGSLSGMPALFTPSTSTGKVGFFETGFTVSYSNGKTFPIVNGSGITYQYIAFR